MRFLFVMDPAEAMLPDKDTTFAFVRAAQLHEHQSYFCSVQSVAVSVGPDSSARVRAQGRPLRVSDSAPHVTVGEAAELDLHELDAIFVRKDPPFDTAYLHLTQMLDLVKHDTLVVNDPNGLRAANEKLFALNFHEWMPATRVTNDRDAILAFVEEVGGQAVLKPLDGAGGSGVVALRSGDKNNRALIDLLTHEGREPAMVQAFQPAIATGDKRVLLLEGRPLGAILRVPRPDDIRANIHVGGTVRATELTEDETRLVEALAPRLVATGLWFVGLDLIGGRLIEVNVTSPTGIQELGRLTHSTPERDVIRWVEQRVRGA